MTERSFDPGETIYAPGAPDDRLYFLIGGAIRTYKTYGDFKEATTTLLKDGGVFGGLDLAEVGSQEEFAQALTETRVTEVRKAAVAWLVKRRPEVAFALVLRLLREEAHNRRACREPSASGSLQPAGHPAAQPGR